MPAYATRITVRRTPLTSDSKGGYTEGTAFVVYDGWAEVEEDGRLWEAALRQDSVLQERGGAVATLSEPHLSGQLRPNDAVTLLWDDGTEATATVRRIVRTVGRVTLTY